MSASKTVLAWDVGLRTLSYCVMTGTWSAADSCVHYTIHHWDAVDVQLEAGHVPEQLTGAKKSGTRKKVDTVSVEEGARMVCDAVHRRAAEQFDRVDTVIIEQQPAGGHNKHSNVRMKVMSHALQMYFYVRNLVQPAPARQQQVCFVSPASKLVDMKKDAEVDKEKSVGQLYTRNKKYAVHKTAELLLTPGLAAEANRAWRALFDSSNVSKKDDLADAFLLNFYYLQKQLTPKKSAKRKRASTGQE